jgi:hypothetical protein
MMPRILQSIVRLPRWWLLACGCVLSFSLVARGPISTVADEPDVEGPIGKVDESDRRDFPSSPETRVARVGDGDIFAGEVIPLVDAHLRRMLEQSGNAPPEQIERIKSLFYRRALTELIEAKLAYQGFLKHLVSELPADKVASTKQKIRGEVIKSFYEKVLPAQFEDMGVRSLTELDAKLRQEGRSLQRQEDNFVETVIGNEYKRGKYTYDKKDPEILGSEMRQFYKDHYEDYRRDERARWIQLTVLFSKHESRDEALELIKRMGQEAYYGRIDVVARQYSEDPLSGEGGLHDWIRAGSLASQPLNDAIFSLPLDRMSEIIEDDNGFHIVKVVEREPQRYIPFSQVQEEIRKQLVDEKKRDQRRELVEKLRTDIPVWSYFPNDLPYAKAFADMAMEASFNDDSQPR